MAVQQSAAQTTKGKVSIRADAAVARASAKSRASDLIPAEAGRSFPLPDSALPIITWARTRCKKRRSEQHNYLKDGFLCEDERGRNQMRRSRAQCADIDRRRNRASKRSGKTGMSPDDAGKARENAIAQIEKESKDKTGLRSDVVTLYQGGALSSLPLQTLRRRPDSFRARAADGFYGGDPDNFEYPRFDLDICIFRAYENGQPAKIEHYLKWNSSGPSDGELTFVSGSPGTNRPATHDR